MKNLTNSDQLVERFASLFVFLVFMLISFLGYSQNYCEWKTVGSTGIVDENAREAIALGRITPPIVSSSQSAPSNATNFSYEDMSAHLRPNVQPGAYSIRYQLPPISHACLGAVVKLSDPALDKITIILKEYDIENPGENAKIIYSFSTQDQYFDYDKDKYKRITVPSRILEKVIVSCEKLYFIETVLETSRPPRPTAPTINTKVIGPSIAAIYLGLCVFD